MGMYFETAPIEHLCGCVSVELTTRDSALIDNRPDLTQKVVNGALRRGQQRFYDADCSKCNATGVKPEFY